MTAGTGYTTAGTESMTAGNGCTTAGTESMMQVLGVLLRVLSA